MSRICRRLAAPICLICHQAWGPNSSKPTATRSQETWTVQQPTSTGYVQTAPQLDGRRSTDDFTARCGISANRSRLLGERRKLHPIACPDHSLSNHNVRQQISAPPQKKTRGERKGTRLQGPTLCPVTARTCACAERLGRCGLFFTSFW